MSSAYEEASHVIGGEHRDDIVTTRKLPPPHERILAGSLERKFLTSKGIKWIPRFAVLSAEHLVFAKQHLAKSCPELSEDDARLAEKWARTLSANSASQSADKLRETFERFDADKSGALDLEEATAALFEMNMCTTDDLVAALFQLLDVDGNGTLDMDEFLKLAEHVDACNTVVDFIPLHEIYGIDVEIELREGNISNQHAQTDFDDTRRGSPALRRQQSSFKRVIKTVEQMTGMELVESSALDEVTVPPYDPRLSEVHMVLHTAASGHNSGKSYSHRLHDDNAQLWVTEIARCVKEAKAREDQRKMELVYGQGRLAAWRAMCKQVFDSNAFQMFVAFLIIFCFGLDLTEAQLLPEKGSHLSQVLFALDSTTTALFTIELFMNLFAHSQNNFLQFREKTSNWVDTFIVVMSISNVLLTLANIELPNAKLLRLLRLTRIVRIFKSLRNLQKIINAASAAVLPVCNAFFILLIIASGTLTKRGCR